MSPSLTFLNVPLDRRLSSWGSNWDKSISEGSKSVVGPIYWLYRSSCNPSVRFNKVGPPILAMSSINEFVAPGLEILDASRPFVLSSVLSGDLGAHLVSRSPNEVYTYEVIEWG